MAKSNKADCGIHPYSDMDTIYTCASCIGDDSAKEAWKAYALVLEAKAGWTTEEAFKAKAALIKLGEIQR